MVICAAVGLACAQSRTFELTDAGLEPKNAPAPGTDAAVIGEARRLLAEGQPGKATDILDTWIEANETSKSPYLPEAYLVRGDAIRADGDEYEALVNYEKICKDYPASDVFVTALERELEVAQLYLGGLRKKSLGFLRIDTGVPHAEEIITRINERLPGSKLAERALLALCDYYYTRRDLRGAAETYDVFLTHFPRSASRQKALQRRIYSNIAQFKGPSYDASGLVEAQYQIDRYRMEYPADAERSGMGDALSARLDESAAQQIWGVSEWYKRRGDPPGQRFALQRLVKKHPNTSAAQLAIETLTKNNWPIEAPVRLRIRDEVAAAERLNKAAADKKVPPSGSIPPTAKPVMEPKASPAPPTPPTPPVAAPPSTPPVQDKKPGGE